MKMSLGKKTVLFLHWLASLVLAVLAVGLCFWLELVQKGAEMVNGWIGASKAEILGIALLGVYVLLAVLSVVFIFSGSRKRGERGFITVDSSEAGRTRIAIGAVDQMIRQAVRGVDGVVDMKSSIINCEDAISIHANITIVSGAHVPTVTMNMQRAVRSYIELNCGVAVREVCVSVNALESGEGNGKRGHKKVSEVAPVVVPQPVVVEKPQAVEMPVVDAVPEEMPAENEPEPEQVHGEEIIAETQEIPDTDAISE